MISSEQDAIDFSRQIRDAYQAGLERPIDYSGYASYLLWHMHINGQSIDWVKEILSWGELPPVLPICDGWDAFPDGTWPMIGVMHDSQREAVFTDARAKHRNTLAILAAHPGGSNGAEIPPDLARVQDVDWLVRAGGFRPFHWLWSAEAEQRWGEGKRYVWDCSAVLPVDTDIAVIESDEYWDGAELSQVIGDLPRPQRFWCHYTPGQTAPSPAQAHGLAYQADESEVETAIVALSNAAQDWADRPVLFAEAQFLGTAARWQVAQWGFRRGIGSLHAGRPHL